MYREQLPAAERFEFDPGLWSEWPDDKAFQTRQDRVRVYQQLGQLAIQATAVRPNTSSTRRSYLRSNDRLDAADIRELERYFDFLRYQFGIPEGATIFPKRDPKPAVPVEPEDDDAA